jgi:hypothetical protein
MRNVFTHPTSASDFLFYICFENFYMHPKYSVGSFHRMKNDFLKFMVKFELTEIFSFVQSKKPKFYQKSDSILIGRLYRFIYGRENVVENQVSFTHTF